MKLKMAGCVALAVLLAGACTASDDSDSASDSNDETTSTTFATGPAPGVTDDTIKIGVTYVDLDAVRQFVDLDQGDYEASYQAVIDAINDDGGIHGRMIEAVYAPVSPLGTAPAEEVCVRLTEDEDVFAVMGFFQDDAVLCPVAAHETAVIGGVMTDERYEQAKAPWFTTQAGQDSNVDALTAMAEAGALDGKVGVFASIYSEGELEPALQVLDDLGIEPVDTAVLDAPTDDLAAQNQATGVIMERFETAGVDQVLALGSAAVPLANGLAPLDYRPQLLFTSAVSVGAYTAGIDPDYSMFEGAVLGSINNSVYEEEAMQECIGLLEDAGISGIVDPATLEATDPNPFISAATACTTIGLFAAIAEAAGEDLNYGSFQGAGESLGSLHLPGAEADYEYGPYPSLDGDQPMFLWDWNAEDQEFVVREE
jgi:hypothetical protein